MNLFYDRAILQNQAYRFATTMKTQTAYEGRILPDHLSGLFFYHLHIHICMFITSARSEQIFAGLYDLWMRCFEQIFRTTDILQYMISHKLSTVPEFRQRQDDRLHHRPQGRGQSPNPPHG